MKVEMAWREHQNRPRLVVFTCWAIWLILIPFTGLGVARFLGVPGIWDAPGVSWGMPYIAIFPLSLIILSSVGLWRMKTWGVLVYGFAGLLVVLILIMQPQVAIPLGMGDIPKFLESLIIAALHAIFTWRLWEKIG